MSTCKNCGKTVSLDEIGLTKKLINRGASEFLCFECLEKEFHTTKDKLLELILAGSRNATMSQKAGCIVKRYSATKEAHALFMAEAEKCVPPLDQDELDAIWNSAKKFGERSNSLMGMG